MKKIITILLAVFSLIDVSAQIGNIRDSTAARDSINHVFAPNSTRAISAKRVNNVINGLLNIMPYDIDTIYVSNDTMKYKKRGIVIVVPLNSADLNFVKNDLTATRDVTHHFRSNGTDFNLSIDSANSFVFETNTTTGSTFRNSKAKVVISKAGITITQMTATGIREIGLYRDSLTLSATGAGGKRTSFAIDSADILLSFQDSSGKFIAKNMKVVRDTNLVKPVGICDYGRFVSLGYWPTGSGGISSLTASTDATGTSSGSSFPLTVTGIRGFAIPTLASGWLRWNGSAWVFAVPTFQDVLTSNAARTADAYSTSSTGRILYFGSAGHLFKSTYLSIDTTGVNTSWSSEDGSTSVSTFNGVGGYTVSVYNSVLHLNSQHYALTNRSGIQASFGASQNKVNNLFVPTDSTSGGWGYESDYGMQYWPRSTPPVGTVPFATSGGKWTFADASTVTGIVAGSYSNAVTSVTTFTVTIGVTKAANTYKVNVTPTAVLSAAPYYVTNKTTTTFDVVFLSALTGTVTFDWTVVP